MTKSLNAMKFYLQKLMIKQSKKIDFFKRSNSVVITEE